MIRIAQFSTPENGGIFGQAGDQLMDPAEAGDRTFFGEVDIIDWSDDWVIIYRPVRRDVAYSIAYTMEAAARNPMVGYSQGTARLSFGQALAEAGGDAALIDTPCNSDCSAGIAAAVRNAGVMVNANMTTRTEDRELMQTGEFIKIASRDILGNPERYLRGDILWRPGHTGTCIDDGSDVYGGWVRIIAACHRRIGPSVTYRSIGTFKPADKVLYLNGFSDRWLMMLKNDMIAWTSSKYIEETGMGAVLVTGFTVWIRMKPYKESRAVKLAHRGQLYVFTGLSDIDSRGVTWYQVQTDDGDGWISSKYSEVRE